MGLIVLFHIVISCLFVCLLFCCNNNILGQKSCFLNSPSALSFSLILYAHTRRRRKRSERRRYVWLVIINVVGNHWYRPVSSLSAHFNLISQPPPPPPLPPERKGKPLLLLCVYMPTKLWSESPSTFWDRTMEQSECQSVRNQNDCLQLLCLVIWLPIWLPNQTKRALYLARISLGNLLRKFSS